MTEPTYEELQAQVERLRVHGTRCANELVYMINTHNEHNINDDSYKYDHQTPVEFLYVANETHTQSLAALKARWQAEVTEEIMHCLFYAPSSPVKPNKAEEIKIWWGKYKNTQDTKCGCKTESDEKFGTLIYKCKQHDDSITANANTGSNK